MLPAFRFLSSLVILDVLLDGSALCATLVVGSLPAPPSFVAASGIATHIDRSHPALADGVLNTATFIWSNAPCSGAAKLKIFRPSGSGDIQRVDLITDRGPFDVSFVTQTVKLDPPVAVRAGDLLAVTNLTDCGTATFREGRDTAINFPGDVEGAATYLDKPELVFVGSLEARASSTELQPVTNILPVAISARGQSGSYFKTRLQLRNPRGVGTITGQLVVHPASTPASPSDPALSYSIGPWETQTIDDLLGAIGLTGIGTVDVIPTSIPSDLGPTIQATIYTQTSGGGIVSFSEPALAPADLEYPSWAGSGAGGTLLGPSDPSRSRLNIGIRTLDAPTTIHVVIFDANGLDIGTWTRDYPANFFEQVPASELLGGRPLGPNTAFEFRSGNAIIYGVAADNISQSAVFKLVRPDL